MNQPRFVSAYSLSAFCLGLGLAASPAWAQYDSEISVEILTPQTVDGVDPGGPQEVKDGGVTHGFVITGDGATNGVQKVNAGGTANDTKVMQYGTQHVNGGGTANATTVESGGIQNVSGGTADGTVLNGGAQNVTGSAANTVINDDGVQTIFYSGVATDTTINHGGTQRVLGNGTANSTIVENGGAQQIANNGASINLTVNSGGALIVDSGKTAKLRGENIIKDGGKLSAGATETIELLHSSILSIERDLVTPDTTLDNKFTGAGGLAKTGGGTLTLTGENSYSGGTSLNEGRINVGNDNALGTGILDMGAGSSLGFTGNFSLANNINLVKATSATVDTGAYNATLAGTITGGGSLTKTGSGTLALNGVSDAYIGSIVLNKGRIDIGNGSALGTGALHMANGTTLGFASDALEVGNNISLGGAATVDTGANDEMLSGIISGAGSLTKTGSGGLTLEGANTYSGLTDVRQGSLILGDGASLASATMALHGGAAFVNGGAGVSLSRLDVYGSADWVGDLNMAGKILNFYVPATMSAGDRPMLSVDGDADIADATVKVGLKGAKSALNKGDRIVLIDAAGALSGAPRNSSSKGEGMQGVTLKYGFDLMVAGNELLATVNSVGANRQSKALSEGFLTGLALLNETANRVAEQGMGHAVRAARKSEASPDSGSAFVLASGGSSRYDSGSYADLHSTSLVAGLSWGKHAAAGRATLGAFVEYGDGSYDTYNSFADAASVRGKGDLRHAGGGVLGRFDLDSGAYVEGSIRGGALRNKFRSSDLGSYTTASAYYGAHAGAGYVLPINRAASVDAYGKYFWTRVEGDFVMLPTGDPVKFDAADSSRLRLGARVSFAVSDSVTPYAGLAYEREFAAKAKGEGYGYAINKPSLDGDTGIGELGLSVKPSKTLPLSVDLSVQGYTGKREGVTGSLLVRYAF